MTQTNAKNELTLEIDSLSYGPYGMGRYEGKAVMVPNTAPGDRIAAHVVAAKERYAIGEVTRLLHPSPVRQTPPCPYVGECGGCSWQHVRYDAQLKAKQRSVEDALRRIGKLMDFELRPIIPSSREFHYRRRIRLQSDGDKRLGFYRSFSHELVEIDSCLIADEQVDAQIGMLRQWVGYLETPIDELEIVAGDKPGEIIVAVTAQVELTPRDEAHCGELLQRQSSLCGLIVTAHGRRRCWGQTQISVFPEKSVRLRVEADVFTQVNTESNETLLKELLAAGNFQSSDRVLELYSGAGNFTLSIAKRAREVVSVEAHRPSVNSGRLSAQLNGLSNTRWIVSSVPTGLERLAKQGERFSKIVLDPPRAGAKGIESKVAAFGAGRILYVSCNPTTLARDLAGLAKHGYKLARVQPIDLFPQTFHVETLAVMTR